MKKNNIYEYAIAIAIFIVVVLFAFKILFFRLDLTEEKRFSITKASKNILKNITEFNISNNEETIILFVCSTSVNREDAF